MARVDTPADLLPLVAFTERAANTYIYLIMFVRQNSAAPAESNLSEWLSY
jgi:hypothetical protein